MRECHRDLPWPRDAIRATFGEHVLPRDAHRYLDGYAHVVDAELGAADVHAAPNFRSFRAMSASLLASALARWNARTLAGPKAISACLEQ